MDDRISNNNVSCWIKMILHSEREEALGGSLLGSVLLIVHQCCVVGRGTGVVAACSLTGHRWAQVLLAPPGGNTWYRHNTRHKEDRLSMLADEGRH